MPTKKPAAAAQADAPLASVTVQNPGQTDSTAATAALARAEALVISNHEQYEAAVAELKAIKAKFNEVDGHRKELKKPLDEAVTKLQAFFRSPLDFLIRAESILKRKVLAYQQEQEIIRRKEQAKLDEAARKEQAKLAEQAAKAAAAGKVEKAELLQQRATTVVAHTVVREAPKVSGLSTRKTYSAEVTDLQALVKAVAEGRAPLSFLQANYTVLNQQARSLKTEFVCDGVKVIESDSLAASAA